MKSAFKSNRTSAFAGLIWLGLPVHLCWNAQNFVYIETLTLDLCSGEGLWGHISNGGEWILVLFQHPDTSMKSTFRCVTGCSLSQQNCTVNLGNLADVMELHTEFEAVRILTNGSHRNIQAMGFRKVWICSLPKLAFKSPGMAELQMKKPSLSKHVFCNSPLAI